MHEYNDDKKYLESRIKDIELKQKEKLKTSKPTITGKEVKIDKDTYDTLNNFMNTSKRVIKDMPRNQALFKELTEYTQTYNDLEIEKRNIQYEVRRLEYKNKELQQENNKFKNLLNIMVQSLKQFLRKLLKLGTENDKDKVVEEITSYHKLDLYTNKDLHDIADNTPREDKINDYLYTKNYEKDDRDFDI